MLTLFHIALSYDQFVNIDGFGVYMITYSEVVGYELELEKSSMSSSGIYVNKEKDNIKLTTSKYDGRNCESCSVTLTKEQAKELADLLLKMID